MKHLQAKVILTVFFVFILFCANLLLNLIELLTSN